MNLISAFLARNSCLPWLAWYLETKSHWKIPQAVSKFQRFAGLEVTGLLDKETVDMMLKPRCGVKDFIDDDEDVDTPRIKVKSTLSRKKVRPLRSWWIKAESCGV